MGKLPSKTLNGIQKIQITTNLTLGKHELMFRKYAFVYLVKNLKHIVKFLHSLKIKKKGVEIEEANEEGEFEEFDEDGDKEAEQDDDEEVEMIILLCFDPTAVLIHII